MFAPRVNASAPIAGASCPTCTRTSAKLVPKNDSIVWRTAGGSGCPPVAVAPARCGGATAVLGAPCGKNPWITSARTASPPARPMRRRPRAHRVRFRLQPAVLHDRDARAERVAYAAGALLQHVRELVAEDLLALRRGGVVLARREGAGRA